MRKLGAAHQLLTFLMVVLTGLARAVPIIRLFLRPQVAYAAKGPIQMHHQTWHAEITLTVPESPEQMQDTLNDEAKLKALMLNPEGMKEFVKGYMTNVANDNPDMIKQTGDMLQKGLAEFIEDHGFDGGQLTRVPMDTSTARQMAYNGGSELAWFRNMNPAQRMAALAAYEPEARGAALDGHFKRMSDYYTAIDWQTRDGRVERMLTDAQTKVLGESQGDAGGFLVPEEFRVQLLSLALERAIIRSRAMVIPMTTLKVRIPAIRDTTHASTVFGGIQAFWTPESGSFTQTEPTFSQVALDAKKLMGGTRVGNELIRDSAISLEALLNRLFASAIAYFEDDAFINGVGGGQPIGILNADAMISVTKETGQAATTIVWENLIKMYSRMLPASLGNAVWIAHNDTFPQLATMALNVGTGGSAVWINNGVAGPPATILGRPVLFTEKAQTLGTAGDIYFVDPSFYLIGDRQSLEIASSIHTRFNTDETEWRFIERLDGKPWIDSALTPRNGSNTVSPFINLATRS